MTMKLAFFICFIITFIFSSSSNATLTTGSINWWCTQTPHHQTCNRYVAKSNVSIATTATINQFLDMTVKAAIDEAHVVIKGAQRIYMNYPNAPGKSLWGSCVDYFNGIVFTLNMVLDRTNQFSPLDVHSWLSAGLTYINVCEKGFELINKTNTLLPIKSTNLTLLLLNSLAISVAIRGISNSNSRGLNEWEFSELSDLTAKRPDVVVAKDGSGDFTTVQEAVNSAGNRRWGQRYAIYVKSGVYEEQVVIPKEVNFIVMFGDGINKTIITGGQHSGGNAIRTMKAGDLKSSATFQVWGRRFIALHLTFRNTAGPEGGQAVAFLSASDRSVVYRCSIEGYQDTLFTFHSKQFYKQCQIFGTVDFIFGSGEVVFQDCDIFLRKPLPGGGLVVTANGRKYHNESGGYTMQGCKITAAEDLRPVIGEYKKAFLGRPWFPHGRTVYMQSFLDDLVDPQGWLDSWGFNKTAYCGEYDNSGPGSSTAQRVKWHGYEAITDPIVAVQFTVAEFIAGNQWLPTSGVPFVPGFEKL